MAAETARRSVGPGGLLELPVGAWYRGSFTTAWLCALDLLAAEDQRAAAERYPDGAIGACEALLA